LHNVKNGTHYPPTFIVAADNDDHCPPFHAMKFAAALQAAQAGENPILLCIQQKTGHGFGKPTWKIIEAQSNIYAFLSNVFGLTA
jgi:prolyl oligopeptidase